MTKEELYELANDYVNESKNNDCTIEAYEVGYLQALTDSTLKFDKQLTEKDKQLVELREELAEVCNLKGCMRIAELEAQIEKMKCCYNCSKWNDGECEESPKSKTFFCADFKCDNWEMFK